MNRAAVLVAIVAVAAGCGGKHEPTAEAKTAPPAVQAVVYAAEMTSLGTQYQAVGTVMSAQSSTIQSNAVGHITAIHVKEGDVVEAGAKLVELDSREAVAMVQKAESAVTQAQRGMEEVNTSALAAESAKAAAQADLSLAQATFDRYKNLSEQQAVSRQVLDEATAKLKSATAAVNQAAENVNAFAARKAESAARLQQAQAELENARVQLSHTEVTAPFGGVITGKYAEVGDLASPGVPLLAIEDNKHFRLEAVVDEARISLFTIGAQAPVTIDALGTGPLAGIVAEIVPKTDPSSRSIVVKIDLPEQPGLHSGMFGRVTFASGKQQTLTIPASAVFERGQLKYVFAVDENQRAHLRLVQTGKQYGDRVEILSGLSAGETVVATNVTAVTDGALIKPVTGQ